MKRMLLLPLLLLGLALRGQSRLTVEARLSKPDAGGVVRLALCPDAASFSNDKGCLTAEARAFGAVVRAEFAGVPSGGYALKAFHDVNANGVLDTNWMGIPKEPYGFGNDAMGTFGPPDYAAASFEVREARVTVRIRMRN